MARRRRDVHLVIPDPVPRHDLQLPSRLKDAFGIGLDAGDAGEDAGQNPDQFVFRQAAAHEVADNLEALPFQPGDVRIDTLAEMVECHEDLWS